MRAFAFVLAPLFCLPVCGAEITDPNRWIEVARDAAGARPGSAIRYVPDAHAFLLWGFMNDDPELLQEQPLIRIPEYDMVAFDPAVAKWRNELPAAWAAQWSKRLPLAYVPRTYAGITTGSERVVVRGATADAEAAPRLELNVVFDHVVYVPSIHALVYLTGGTTAAYDVDRRRWTDLAPRHSPPPVLGGSLAYDPVHDEVLLFGGGHVAERASDGAPRGCTGTWSYNPRTNDWRELVTTSQPPPRMNTRMVTDTHNNVVVLFGGDGQSHYLADTWLFDLKSRSWRMAKSASGPPARAGHFAVYDDQGARVIIGGGYSRSDLSDMWAFDPREERWTRLAGDVPTGFYLTADIDPERRLLVLATSNRAPGDRITCNVLFPVRTTYMYRMEGQGVVQDPGAPPLAIAKRAPERHGEGRRIDWDALPRNRWVLVGGAGRSAPTRTWGSATFDTGRERILYWGGGHCGYGGSDIDMYDVADNSWRSSDEAPEYPERLWNHGVREAGVTFGGRPWMEHGRRIYAYDPVSRRMVVVRRLRLTGGYDAPLGRGAPFSDNVAPDAVVRPASSYVRFVTWTFDPDSSKWDLAGSAPQGVDTLVSTPHGVVGIDVDWPSKLNDAGYQRTWTAASPRRPAGVYLYSAASRSWKRLDDSAAESPQNLYEMTSLAYDSRRDRIILHGGGARRDELWTFDMQSHQWRNMHPKTSGAPPVSAREAVYLPKEDLFLTYGDGVWMWNPSANAWRAVQLPFDVKPASGVGQNRALVYDPKRDVVFLVLGAGGDDGVVQVYALRYAGHE